MTAGKKAAPAEGGELIWIVWSSRYRDHQFAQVKVAKRTEKCVYLAKDKPVAHLYTFRLLVGEFMEVASEQAARDVVAARMMGHVADLLEEAEGMKAKAEAIKGGCGFDRFGEPILRKGKSRP